LVPICDIADASRTKEKPPEGGSQLNLIAFDQAAINAGFDFRRYFSDPYGPGFS